MRLTLTRISIVIVLVVAALVPALVSPARTILVPATMARSIRSDVGSDSQLERLSFPATHIAFSWNGPAKAGVTFRTTSIEGAVSAWQRAPEVHGSRAAEKRGDRFSAVLAVGHVSDVEWSVVGRDANQVDAVRLDYLNTVDGPMREVRVPSVARASEEPAVITRAEWGADESIKRTSGSCRRRFHDLQQIFVHHTAGANYDRDPAATMRAIYWYHTVRQGWCDLGYNFVIAPDGRIFEGRWARAYKPWELHDSENAAGEVVSGAHTGGYNSGSLGISLMGNYSQIALPPAARRSLVQLMAWETDRHRLNPRGTHTYRNPETGVARRLRYISGHRDAGQTACPGSRVYAELPRIRDEVAAARTTTKRPARITLKPASETVAYGDLSTFEGRLTDDAAKALSGRVVETYFRESGRRWKVGPESVTDVDGRYEVNLEVARSTTVIAVYRGDATTWGAQSRPARVKVAPDVTLEAEGGSRVGRVSHHSTEEVVLSGSVTPAHTRRSVQVRVHRLADDGSYEPLERRWVVLDDQSRYRLVVSIEDDGGTYRAVTLFFEDDDHASARSEPVFLVVDP